MPGKHLCGTSAWKQHWVEEAIHITVEQWSTVESVPEGSTALKKQSILLWSSGALWSQCQRAALRWRSNPCVVEGGGAYSPILGVLYRLYLGLPLWGQQESQVVVLKLHCGFTEHCWQLTLTLTCALSTFLNELYMYFIHFSLSTIFHLKEFHSSQRADTDTYNMILIITYVI